MMLAEASKPELMTNAFDADYAWPMLGALNDVMLHGAAASRIRESWEESTRQFPNGTLHMRMTDDHDEPRAIARYGVRGALATSVLMFTLDGVPLLYNGMEVGDATESGDPALFDKLPIFWSPKDRPPLRKIYQSLIRLRKDNAPFRNGQVQWLHNSNEGDVVTFKRGDDTNEFIIVINLSSRPAQAHIEGMDGANLKPVSIAGMPQVPGDKIPNFRLGGYEWRIYKGTVPPLERTAASGNPSAIETVH